MKKEQNNSSEYMGNTTNNATDHLSTITEQFFFHPSLGLCLGYFFLFQELVNLISWLPRNTFIS